MPPAEPGEAAREVDPLVLAEHAPPAGGDANKFERGQVVVLGGDPETPGGVVLAALAALRAGAGRAHVVTHPDVTLTMAVANPELRVSPLPVGPLIDARELVASIEEADVVVVGTGCRDRTGAGSLVEQVVPLLSERTVLCLDAAALPVVADQPSLVTGRDGRAVLLPNVGEAAELLRVPRDVVEDDPGTATRRAVACFRSPVAIRGSTTWMSAPSRGLYVERAGHPALGTSGSGDVLVGIVAALAARGSDPLGAVLWGVHAHARCGEVLAARHGGYGLLARDLLDQVPSTLNELLRG